MSYGEFRSQLARNTREGFKHSFLCAHRLTHPDEKEIALKSWWRSVDPEKIISDMFFSGIYGHRNATLAGHLILPHSE